jgi:hypothetical protein
MNFINLGNLRRKARLEQESKKERDNFEKMQQVKFLLGSNEKQS